MKSALIRFLRTSLAGLLVGLVAANLSGMATANSVYKLAMPKCEGLGCPRSDVTVVRPGMIVIVSPRIGRVLNDRPLFRWTPSIETTRYRLRLYESGAIRPLWQTDVVQATQVRYPSQAPGLRSNQRYELTVEPLDGVDPGAEPTQPGGLGFEVVRSDEAQTQLKRADEIRATAVSAEAAALELAHAWGQPNVGLWADAIDRLEALEPNQQRSPAVRQELRRLYRAIGLAWPE